MVVGVTLDLMEQIGRIALDAGALILKIHKQGFEVMQKGDASPVTEADQKAEQLILHRIKKDLTNKWPIVAEEAVAAGNIPDIAGTPFWLVDPLDGTKEFAKGGTDFTVNIALIENGRPIAGVVYAPARDVIYWGCAHGAFARYGDKEPTLIRCRAVPERGMTAIVSKSHRTPETDAILKEHAIAQEISVGSSLKFCSVAEGSADFYPRMGRTMEWDTAAGHAVARFAGAEVKTVEGEELTYGKDGFENPHFICRAAETPDLGDAD